MSELRVVLAATILAGVATVARAQAVELPAPLPPEVAAPVHDLRDSDVGVRLTAIRAVEMIESGRRGEAALSRGRPAPT